MSNERNPVRVGPIPFIYKNLITIGESGTHKSVSLIVERLLALLAFSTNPIVANNPIVTIGANNTIVTIGANANSDYKEFDETTRLLAEKEVSYI
jgi:hypothetical protein